jgi:hypothetical protein
MTQNRIQCSLISCVEFPSLLMGHVEYKRNYGVPVEISKEYVLTHEI